MHAHNDISTDPLYRPCGYRKPVVDDRAEKFKPANKIEISQAHERGTHRFFALRRRLNRANMCDRSRQRYACLTASQIITLATVLVCILMIALAIYTPLSGKIVYPTIFLLMIGVAIVQSHFKQIETKYIVAMSALSEGICGSCAFSLEGLITDEYGCVMCPECGHSWNAIRIVRPHWETFADILKNHKQDPRLDLRSGFFYRMYRSWSVDDCGRCVHTPSSRLWILPREVRMQHDPELLKVIKRDLRRLGRAIRVCVTSLGIGGFLIAEYYFVIPEFGTPNGGFVSGSIVMGIGMLLMSIVLLSSLGIRNYKLSRVICSYGCCGSCLNDLRDTPVNANEMRVCDLCRASWLDSRFSERSTSV